MEVFVEKPRIRIKSNMQKASSMAAKDKPKLSVSNYNTGYSNLRQIQDYVDSEQIRALRWPNSLSTYDKMFYDHDVNKGYYMSQLFVEKAFDKPNVSYNKASAASKEAADFVKWNLSNMTTTLQECIRNAYSCKRYGFSILVKNYEEITYGKYKDKFKYKIQKLSPRAQKTLNAEDPFIIKNGDVVAARQDLTQASYASSVFKIDMKRFNGKPYVDIPRHKFMLFSYNSINGNPLGCSVFQSIYKPWREKILIADYQTIGVSKDVGGTPILYAPSEVLTRAAEDPSSREGVYIRNIMNSLGEWHSGDTAYMMMPSDLQEGSTTQREFEIKLIGIDGGAGKQFNTSELIEERQKAILNAFGAGFSTLGQDGGGGSYSLASTQKGLHSFYIEKDINFLLEVFNSELIPQLLALNDIYLEEEDMPKLVHGVVDEKDADLASKAIQRVTAVGQMPVCPELINESLHDLGYEYRIPQSVIDSDEAWEEYKRKYLPKAESRSGDSLNTSSGGANGTSEDPSQVDNDAANNDS